MEAGEHASARDVGGTQAPSRASSSQTGGPALRSTLGIVLEGATVTMVIPGGPAWRASQDGQRIEVGDVVRAVDGQEITMRNAAAAMRGSDLPGTPVRVEVEKRSSSASGKWTSLDRSMLPAEQSKVVEFMVVRQDVEMVMLLKNMQTAFGNTWKSVSEGGRVQHPLEDLERCFDALVAYTAEDDARLRQAVRELERKSGVHAGGEMQSVDLAMLSQQAANEVGQARQRIRTLEMQLAMVNGEIESSREEERRARAAALEAQEVFRRNDADLRAEIESLQEGMVRLERKVRDESCRADEAEERVRKELEEGRILRSNTEAMQIELERADMLKNKSSKASSEAVALALREVLLVQDELSAAKFEIEEMKESERLVNERLRVIETARDTMDLGEGHRNEQLKTLRAEIVFLRKTIEAIKDERAQMREHIAKQAREIVVLDNKLSDKAAQDSEELDTAKADLFKTKNALRLRETQLIALEDELRRRTLFNSQQFQAQSAASVTEASEVPSRLGDLPLLNPRFDDIVYVLVAALAMAFVIMLGKSFETFGKSPVISLVVVTSGILFWILVAVATFKCALWIYAKLTRNVSPSIVTSLPEKTPLLPTAGNYHPIQDKPHSAREQLPYQNAAPSSARASGGHESLRNPDFKYVPKYAPSSVYTPTGEAMSRDSGDPSAYHATQKYLSTTSGRPLSFQGYQTQEHLCQGRNEDEHARGAGDVAGPMESKAPLTERSSVARRSREERLASLKGTVKRQEDISMA